MPLEAHPFAGGPRRILAAIALIAVVLFSLPRGAAADSPPATLTPIGGAIRLDHALGVKEDRAAGGAMLSIPLSPILSFELRALGTSSPGREANPALDLVDVGGNFTWFWDPDLPVTPFLTMGAGELRLNDQSRFAGNGGAGFLMRFSDYLGFRLDARDVFFRVPAAENGTWRQNLEASAGISFFLGNAPRPLADRRPEDSIHDEAEHTAGDGDADHGHDRDADRAGRFDDGFGFGTDAWARFDRERAEQATHLNRAVIAAREEELRDTGMIRLEGVRFEPESDQSLDEVGDVLRRWPELRIEIGAYTDSREFGASERDLTRLRARAVRDYLLRRFPDLSAGAITARGYGDSAPIADNRTEHGRDLNRRIEIRALNREALGKGR